MRTRMRAEEGYAEELYVESQNEPGSMEALVRR